MRFQWFVVDNNGNKQVEWVEPKPQSIEDIKFENEKLRAENNILKLRIETAKELIIELQNEITLLRGNNNGR